MPPALTKKTSGCDSGTVLVGTAQVVEPVAAVVKLGGHSAQMDEAAAPEYVPALQPHHTLGGTRHWTPSQSTNEDYQCVSMTWQSTCAEPYPTAQGVHRSSPRAMA